MNTTIIAYKQPATLGAWKKLKQQIYQNCMPKACVVT
jgi:hypothetical protein